MQLLVISDRPPERSVSDLLDEHEVDAIVTLGDLDYYGIEELEGIDLPKLGVYGERCPDYFEGLGIVDLHLRTFELGGMTFGGFQGATRGGDNAGAKTFDQEEASTLLATFPRVDVMLAHMPPRGVNDEDVPGYQGFGALRDYVLREQPRYLLHGHAFPLDAQASQRLGATEILYVGGGRIIPLER